MVELDKNMISMPEVRNMVNDDLVYKPIIKKKQSVTNLTIKQQEYLL